MSSWAAALGVGAIGAYIIYRATRPKVVIGECCPGQSAGFLPQDPSYAPKGQMLVLGGGGGGGVEAYVSGSGARAVVICHDIFGLHTGRHKQIADELAARGFTVVVPDFFQGDGGGGLFGRKERGYGMGLSTILRFLLALVSGRMKSFQRLHPWDPVCARIWREAVVPFLQSRSCTSVGLLSFCWGAYPALHAAALPAAAADAAADAADAAPPLPVTANVFFHPSFDSVARTFGEDQEALVKAAGRVPTFVVATSMEPAAWKPGGQAHGWMREAFVGAGGAASAGGAALPRWEVATQMHGFMVRGDMKKSLALANDVQRLLEGAIAFLAEHAVAEGGKQ